MALIALDPRTIIDNLSAPQCPHRAIFCSFYLPGQFQKAGYLRVIVVVSWCHKYTMPFHFLYQIVNGQVHVFNMSEKRNELLNLMHTAKHNAVKCILVEFIRITSEVEIFFDRPCCRPICTTLFPIFLNSDRLFQQDNVNPLSYMGNMELIP